jgi:hypothetical protein
MVVIERGGGLGAGDNPHGRLIIGQVDDVTRLHFDADAERRAGGGSDAGDAQHERAGAIADDFVGGVEQFRLGCAGARRGDAKASDNFLAQVFDDVRLVEGAG